MTKLPDAIRVLREDPFDTRALAIASALEELDERTRILALDAGEAPVPRSVGASPFPGRYHGEGEAPSPLPEVLPVGTLVDGVFGASRLDAAARRSGDLYKCDNGGHFTPLQVDWYDYRCTHSPPPSREGEALPGDERDGFHRTAFHRANGLCSAGHVARGPAVGVDCRYCLVALVAMAEQRAEAAEARERSLEGQLARESRQHGEALDRHLECEKDFEAARARVGELTAAARLECVISLEQAARFLQSFAEAVGQPRADAERWDFGASARHMMMCLGVRAHVVPHATEPTPSAPTPAATFAAVADALPTNAEDERIVDALMAKRPVVTRPLASAPTPADNFSSTHAFFGEAGALTPAVAPMPPMATAETYRDGGIHGAVRVDRAPNPAVEGKPDIDDPWLRCATCGREEALPFDDGDRCPMCGGALRPIEGSQPAEENSVRSWWDKYRIHESYDVQLPNTRQRIRDAYRFAHSEGAKAAKAEG